MKKYVFSYFLGIIILSLFLGMNVFGAENKQIRYYATTTFVETPLSRYEGSIPLTPEKALTRNHYRFEYDDRSRLVSISFYNGNIRRTPNHTANLFVLASEIKIQYLSNKEIVTFYDRFGNQREVLGNVAKFIYTLNSHGFRKTLYFEDLKGKQVENSWKIYEYKWNYKRDGAVIENRLGKDRKQISIRPGFEFYGVRLRFDQRGRIALLQNVDRQGNLVENESGAAQDVIETNVQGNFLAWNVLDKNGNPEKGNGPDVARGIQTFDEFGNEIGIRHEDENGNPIYNSYGICMSRTQFDYTGNMISRTFYDEKGNPAPHKRAGYVTLRLFWDKTRTYRTGLEYYDAEGRKTEHLQRGYATVKQEYDENGNLSKISYFDKQGNLTDRKDHKFAYVVFEYDDKNRRVTTTRYNKQGMVIK